MARCEERNDSCDVFGPKRAAVENRSTFIFNPMPVDSSRPVTTARRESRQAGHKRTYQACRECRTAKLRCDLGDPDAPDEPPCRRCLRTGRECTFGGVYQRNEKGVVVSRTERRGSRKGSTVAAATAVDDGMNNGIPAEGSGGVLADRSDTPVASR